MMIMMMMVPRGTVHDDQVFEFVPMKVPDNWTAHPEIDLVGENLVEIRS